MDAKTKKKLRILLFIISFFSFQLLLIALINVRWINYYKENEVKEFKDDMVYFTSSHKNPDSELFIEPNIESTYRAIDSINYTRSIAYATELINPRSNPHLDDDMKDLFFYYLFEKQNDNGSFSDIVGLGNMFLTYEVVETIDKLDGTFINEHNDEYDEYEVNKIGLIIQYLKNNLDENGYGFKFNEYSPVSDIISTYCAIRLAKRFSAEYIYNNNENMTRYINITWVDATPEFTYYRIKSYFELGLGLNSTQKTEIGTYFSVLYNYGDGGYSTTIGGQSDIQTTYYALSTLYNLNLTPTDQNNTLDYVLNCSKIDGGFGYRPDNFNNTYISDFKSGWAAMNSIYLLEKNISLGTINLNDYIIDYYDWLYSHQAENGLFGDITLQSNYYGVLSLYEADPEGLPKKIEIKDIWDFVVDCYDKEKGGFSSIPDERVDIFSTFCAVTLYKIFYIYDNKIELPDVNGTIDYLIDLQNNDGGFQLGLDLYEILALFGPLRNILFSILKTNISAVESTYWGVSSLEILGALDRIDEESLMHWMSSCQNADGGFSVILGFHSDTISTYFGLEIFQVLNSEPMSKISAIKFLKNAQKDDGSFDPFPALSAFFELPTSFLITYYASIALYAFNYQPDNVKDLIDWYEDCVSSNTGGVGDYPLFGGDLRNTPYGIILIEELRYDQEFNPEPWTDLITAILLAEILIFLIYGLVKIITILNITVSKILKTRLGIGEKMNINYLKRYPAIYCENLNIYAGGKIIVDSVSMRVEHGEILGVLGESGAGKSTFVKALLGMRKFTGINEIYGMDVKKKSKKMRPIYGYVPQQMMLYNNFTVLQNILYFGKRYDLSDKIIKSKAKRILRTLEIEDKIDEKVMNLSGGQKRRVSIALALIHDPVIIWMDEPTSGLDPVVRENLWLGLTKINEQFNTTLIIITHYPEESRFCHKVAIFGRQRGMIDFGKPKDLLSQLPGKGRKIDLFFNDIQENAIKRLESINGIEMVLENKPGMDFSLFTDLDLNTTYEKIKQEFQQSIPQIMQLDAKMEEYFRIKAIKIIE